ncbi:hypothetical protein CP971_34155 [Streptomyces viridifaciens]|nr:hypothetical protein CP971_34155 [Streptomyces viridifaciens]
MTGEGAGKRDMQCVRDLYNALAKLPGDLPIQVVVLGEPRACDGLHVLASVEVDAARGADGRMLADEAVVLVVGQGQSVTGIA